MLKEAGVVPGFDAGFTHESDSWSTQDGMGRLESL